MSDFSSPSPVDIDSALDSKILYQKAESKIINSIVNGIISLKLDFKSTTEFLDFVCGDCWLKSDVSYKWIEKHIYQNDPNIDKTKPVDIMSKKYKDSMFDNNPVVVFTVKYTQE